MGNNSSLRILTTDVVVIGGSGAGVTAALAAARAGARVILISKGKVGKSGNAIMAGGSMSIDGRSAHDLLGLEANRDITQQGWFESIVKEGFFLSDQPIVEQFAFDGPAIVKEYVHWAERAKVPFKHLANGQNGGFSRRLLRKLHGTCERLNRSVLHSATSAFVHR